MTDVVVRDDPKYQALAALLRQIGPVAIAFSGGVDSTFLAAAAGDALGADGVLLVTAYSETYGHRERADSERFAALLGLRRITLETSELAIPAFRTNPPDRCYHCKRELFTAMRAAVAACGAFTLCDGSNADDTGDFRPGRRALRELAVRSPLLEVGLTKDDIRRLSKALGLPTWNKPSYACLSSRFPYGTPITAELVERVGACEDELHRLGFEGVRVRHHGNTARIEVPAERLADLVRDDVRRQIVERFKTLGYTYVTVDLQGYRTGSLNEVLSDEVRRSQA